MSTMKRIDLNLGSGRVAAELAKRLSEIESISNSAKVYPKLSENPPKVSRKERRALERSAAKWAKRGQNE